MIGASATTLGNPDSDRAHPLARGRSAQRSGAVPIPGPSPGSRNGPSGPGPRRTLGTPASAVDGTLLASEGPFAQGTGSAGSTPDPNGDGDGRGGGGWSPPPPWWVNGSTYPNEDGPSGEVEGQVQLGPAHRIGGSGVGPGSPTWRRGRKSNGGDRAAGSARETVGFVSYVS